MKLATIRDAGGTRAVRIDGDEAVELDAADVGEVLRRDDWRAWASAQSAGARPANDLDFAPLIPAPEKIFCVGLNYRAHILEGGREEPKFPTLFAKFARCLVGARDDVELAPSPAQVDWEAELAVIIGKPARRVSAEAAPEYIGGYAILNDVSVRDWQNRTLQWLQGKTWERSTPLGPYLVTPDEAGDPAWPISCEIDGEIMQDSNTGDFVFGPHELVSYISTIITLAPGDVIATGTPGGVGFARTPPRFLTDGTVMVTRIGPLGECRNVCRRES